ncbi:MAG TPA: LysM peptidoglycan-binding domain-containing protein [Thermoanaerobaculia bacterium]|nr:LysM peptidoglycan-binding domain-containing protein [Thermoanaerobaculia bacterium]
MPLVKAIIEVLDREAIDPTRGLLPLIPVQFNPTEYTLAKGAQIAEINIPGIDSPVLQFIRGQNEKLALDLFYDTTSLGMGDAAVDVRTLTRSIYELVKIQPKTHAPPRIRFTWGLGLTFDAIVESVQQRFTLFNPLGIPLRATLSVSFREYKTLEKQLKELNLQSSDHTKRRVVKRGDTLSRIAADEYDDPREWRRIADANPEATANPLRLQPGVTLIIPPLDLFSGPSRRQA